jgi:hypothetical protein
VSGLVGILLFFFAQKIFFKGGGTIVELHRCRIGSCDPLFIVRRRLKVTGKCLHVMINTAWHKGVLLLNDNARPLSATSTLKSELLPHTLYGSGLAPLDCHMF